MKYIFRIMALPFVVGLLAVKWLFQLCQMSVGFVRYGGEFYTFRKTNEPKLIGEVYEFVKAKFEETQP
jgi:hypothetical protein